MERMPEQVRQLNDLLRADLGSNPRYSWRWADDILHVMEVVDVDGNPVYVEGHAPGSALVTMIRKTETRQLLPFHTHCWVLCALVETSKADGELEGTGKYSWVPVSGPTGPVSLLPFEKPNQPATQYVIDVIRQTRSKTAAEMGVEWNEQMAQKEKRQWTHAYERVKESATAFYGVPGKRGHVSFPGVGSQVIQ